MAKSSVQSSLSLWMGLKDVSTYIPPRGKKDREKNWREKAGLIGKKR